MGNGLSFTRGIGDTKKHKKKHIGLVKALDKLAICNFTVNFEINIVYSILH